MKGLFKQLLITTLLFVGFYANAQQSTNTVGYKVTYSQSTAKYTVWVVPEYSLPNSNNSGATEKGATAQVTVAVPKDFVISNITDIKGSWEKAPLKLGPGQPNQDWSAYPLDANTNYYVIGKSAEETDYGSFNTGVDVALFTFQGNSCLGLVRIIAPNEPFIAASDAKFSLNTANSFYSRSGQPAGGNQNPLEQFRVVAGSAANCSLNLTAVPDNVSTLPTASVTISILANDTKNGVVITANDVTLIISQSPSNGIAYVNADGTIKYTPNAGFSGQDCFQYRICDKNNLSVCSTAQVCVTITGATIVAYPDIPTTPANTPTTTSVLGNDTKNGTPIVPSEVTVSIQTQPSNGTVVVNPNGTIKYTPTTGFVGQDCYTYKVCDKVLNTSCSTAQVCVTVQPAQVISIDLSITKLVDKTSPSLNDVVTFTITVKNNSTTETARNIVIEDVLPAGLEYLSGATSNVGNTYSWLVSQLLPGGTTALTLKAKVLVSGITTNTASIKSSSNPDNNQINNTGDACVSVPILLCQGEALELTAITRVDWYKDGVFFKTGNIITVTESGSYTNKSPNSTCPTNNCCPIVVITQVCCSENICIPITIKKTR